MYMRCSTMTSGAGPTLDVGASVTKKQPRPKAATLTADAPSPSTGSPARCRTRRPDPAPGSARRAARETLQVQRPGPRPARRPRPRIPAPAHSKRWMSRRRTGSPRAAIRGRRRSRPAESGRVKTSAAGRGSHPRRGARPHSCALMRRSRPCCGPPARCNDRRPASGPQTRPLRLRPGLGRLPSRSAVRFNSPAPKTR